MEIEKFLYGHNEEIKYLVNLIGDYSSNEMTLFHQYPDGRKVKYIDYYKPFVYIRDLKKLNITLYDNDKEKANKNRRQYGIKFEKLKTYNHERLEDGYPYIMYGNSLKDIKQYLKEGGLKLKFDDSNKILYELKTEEMYMIQKGVRLFKGINNYDELHKLTYDIETTGLDPERNRVFMIGMKDNRKTEKILGVDKMDDDESERKIILDFFKEYTEMKPTVINHYNGENFDWPFILKRAEKVGLNLYETFSESFNYKVKTTLHTKKAIKRIENSSLKVGNETIKYTKTGIWGINNIDIQHAAKRTQAINTDIKNTKLKYICKFEGIAKKNRMYIEDGSKIFLIWKQNKNYIINIKNNKYTLIDKKYQNEPELFLEKTKEHDYKEILKKVDAESYDDLTIIKGSKIVEQYLYDDLYETNEVDKKYNESSFLLAQMIPTTFERICTMGNAAVWKLIMSAWSYENGLAIPMYDVKEDFSGGLARAFYVGFTEGLGKIDFAGLYPTIQLTYDAFPSADVLNVLKKILLYLLTTRNKYKELANDETIEEVLRSFYKTKQLPLKILNNSLFGALGSGVSFPWGESMLASRITCIGRLHLRKLIRHFINYNYTPILAVTDGVNFKIPKLVYRDLETGKKLKEPVKINDVTFIDNGKIYYGHDAIVKKYNRDILKYNPDENRFIKVDNDGLFDCTLTLSRINYALKIPGYFDKKKNKQVPSKLKLTGNTIKSKGMPEYIEDFIDKSFTMLMENKGDQFVEYYYEYLEKIYYKQIPLKKIASKSKVKTTINGYINRGTDKNGKPLAKQAHMELCISNNLEYEIGTVLYYVNIGTAKSHGDTKVLKNKKTGEEYLASYLIDTNQLEINPDLTGEYNVKKYVEAFNERVEKLLIGFDENIRKNLIKDVPDKREYFTDEELKLKKFPFDSIKEFMYLEEKELRHWNNSGYDPSVIYDGYMLRNENDLSGVEEYKQKLKKVVEKKGFNIKAIYDKLNYGDFVLKKTKDKYTIHKVDENEYLYNVSNEFFDTINKT